VLSRWTASALVLLIMATSYPHSIPTPPFSPHNYRLPDENAENPLKSTINLLDSLVAFYQHERMWVYRTRAMLEEAFPNPPHHQLSMEPGSSGSNGMGVGAPSSLGDHGGHLMGSSPVTAGTRFEDSSSSSSMDGPSTSGGQPTSRWMRRKKGFKLRLDGIRTRRVINTQAAAASGGEEEGVQPREQLLEMFEKMMESRMESCQRVNKLVRDANRAHLHYR